MTSCFGLPWEPSRDEPDEAFLAHWEREDRYDAAVDAALDADDVDAALRRLADEAESYSRKDAA